MTEKYKQERNANMTERIYVPAARDGRSARKQAQYAVQTDDRENIVMPKGTSDEFWSDIKERRLINTRTGTSGLASTKRLVTYHHKNEDGSGFLRVKPA